MPDQGEPVHGHDHDEDSDVGIRLRLRALEHGQRRIESKLDKLLMAFVGAAVAYAFSVIFGGGA